MVGDQLQRRIRGENLVANGFLNEFKLAMSNLAGQQRLGRRSRAGSFAYFGAGTGTSPLPIYLAYLNGSRDAGNPAAYASAATDLDELRRSPAGCRRPNPNPTGVGRTISTAT